MTTTRTDVKYPGRRVRNTRTGQAGTATGYDLGTLSVEYDDCPGRDYSGPVGEFELIPEAADPEVTRIQRNMDLFTGLDDDPFAEED